MDYSIESFIDYLNDEDDIVTEGIKEIASSAWEFIKRQFKKLWNFITQTIPLKFKGFLDKHPKFRNLPVIRKIYAKLKKLESKVNNTGNKIKKNERSSNNNEVVSQVKEEIQEETNEAKEIVEEFAEAIQKSNDEVDKAKQELDKTKERVANNIQNRHDLAKDIINQSLTKIFDPLDPIDKIKNADKEIDKSINNSRKTLNDINKASKEIDKLLSDLKL